MTDTEQRTLNREYRRQMRRNRKRTLRPPHHTVPVGADVADRRARTATRAELRAALKTVAVAR